MLICVRNFYRRLRKILTSWLKKLLPLKLHGLRVSSFALHLLIPSSSSGSNSSNLNKIKSTNFSRPPQYGKKPQNSKSAENTEFQCFRCGAKDHKADTCKADRSKLHCSTCNKKGHVASVCLDGKRSQGKKPSNPKQKNSFVRALDDDTDDWGALNTITHVNEISSNSGPKAAPFLLDVMLNNYTVRFEVDSGNKFTVFDEATYQKLQPVPKLLPTDVFLAAYDGSPLVVLGETVVHVNFRNRRFKISIIVVQRGKPVIGRLWFNALGIELSLVKSIASVSQDIIESTKNSLLSEFSSTFQQTTGMAPIPQLNIKVQPATRPKFFKYRPVPFALRDATDAELDKLEAENVITLIPNAEWGTPLVVIPKKPTKVDAPKEVINVRLCADYKVTINPHLVPDNYPIPRIEEILNQVCGSKFYCTFDIYKAYLHLPVDEETARLRVQAISTHRGTYRVNRLFMGGTVAPAIWQRFMDGVIAGLQGTFCYYDDVVVAGRTLEECVTRVCQLLEHFRANDLHINQNKSVFFESSIKYLGHIRVIDEHGLHKNPEKTDAITKVQRPKNVHELRQFLGFVNYYGKFINAVSAILHPLNSLLQADKPFIWSKLCEKAFQRIKTEVTSNAVLTPYNPSLPLILATDASPWGISAILSHKMPDDSEKPIYFASRSLTKTEQNYSQLDREATAIFWALKKFFDYCYGREFSLVVDNKPLSQILNPPKSLPTLTAV